MMRTLRILTILSVAWVTCPTSALADGDPVRGKQLFNRCTACHSIDGQNKSGPALNGVFGRKAGAIGASW